MRLVSLAGALLLGCLLSAQGAAASTITHTIDFTASDFVTTGGGPAAPFSPVTGSLTLTFDPTLNYDDESSGITLDAINVNIGGLGGTPMFDYFVGGGFARQLIIGMSLNGADGLASGVNDFLLSVSYEPVGWFPAQFFYGQAGSNYLYEASTVSVDFTPLPVTQTPIPGSVLMLLTGLGAMGAMAVFRRRDGAANIALAAA
jgi:hypothetical protein